MTGRIIVFPLRVFLIFAVISISVVLHEVGHFVAFSQTGYGVEALSLGFPPTVAEKTINDVDLRIGSIPLGGYTEPEGKITLEKSNALEHLFIAFSGSMVNFLLAIFGMVYILVFLCMWDALGDLKSYHGWQRTRRLLCLISLMLFWPVYLLFGMIFPRKKLSKQETRKKPEKRTTLLQSEKTKTEERNPINSPGNFSTPIPFIGTMLWFTRWAWKGTSNIESFALFVFSWNLLLGIFNLLPFPGLDGGLAWRSLAAFIPGEDLTQGTGAVIVIVLGAILASVIYFLFLIRLDKRKG